MPAPRKPLARQLLWKRCWFKCATDFACRQKETTHIHHIKKELCYTYVLCACVYECFGKIKLCIAPRARQRNWYSIFMWPSAIFSWLVFLFVTKWKMTHEWRVICFAFVKRIKSINQAHNTQHNILFDKLHSSQTFVLWNDTNAHVRMSIKTWDALCRIVRLFDPPDSAFECSIYVVLDTYMYAAAI